MASATFETRAARMARAVQDGSTVGRRPWPRSDFARGAVASAMIAAGYVGILASARWLLAWAG